MSAPINPDAFDSFMPTSLLRGSGERRVSGRDSQWIGFVAGTRVATPMGYVAVELLSAGDLVLTADGRHARLVWVGTTVAEMTAETAPVRFEIGTMDNMRPLRLGQGHRIRVSGWRAELLFDADAVLATAGSFVNGSDVTLETSSDAVTFVHLMFDRHEIVLAENVPCETLAPDPEVLDRLDDMTRRAAHHALAQTVGAGAAKGVDHAALPLVSEAEARVLLAA
jgi:hypothetical protein